MASLSPYANSQPTEPTSITNDVATTQLSHHDSPAPTIKQHQYRVVPSDLALPALAVQITVLRGSYMLWAGLASGMAGVVSTPASESLLDSANGGEGMEIKDAPVLGCLGKDWACAMPSNNVCPLFHMANERWLTVANIFTAESSRSKYKSPWWIGRFRKWKCHHHCSTSRYVSTDRSFHKYIDERI
jgi:hypothetical protein